MKREHCLPLHHAQPSVIIAISCASCAVKALSFLFNSQKGKIALFQLYRTWPSGWLLVVPVRSLQAARARRHSVHCTAQAAAHLFALVSPHNRPTLLVVLLHRVHIVRAVVHRHELLCPFHHVLVLRTTFHGIPTLEEHRHAHHVLSTNADDCRLCRQHLGSPVPAGG